MKHFVLNIRILLIIKMLINSNYFVCRTKSQTPKDIIFSVSWGKEKTSYIHIWEASGSEFWVCWWFCRAAYQLIEKIKVNTFHVELKCFLEYYRIAIWPSKTFFFNCIIIISMLVFFVWNQLKWSHIAISVKVLQLEMSQTLATPCQLCAL